MKKLLPAVVAIGLFACLSARAGDEGLQTPFERSGGLRSATYGQAIRFYKQLDSAYSVIQMQRIGPADGGNSLHVVYFSPDGDFNPAHWQREQRVVILINNGIHPGEPDGIDASMMLLRDAALGKMQVPTNVVLAVIPVYNVGGAKNRGATSRANQNGPEEYGFRGNAQNLDLNRDFIKCDAAETSTLEKLFTRIDPDIFVDNHVSDGADYQHIMTLLATQHDKLGGKTGAFMYDTFTPSLYKDMKKAGYDMVPYVNDFDNTPVNGWTEFYEPPRFSSGYAALFQTIAYVPETHMLKPFKDRVTATYALMQCIISEAGDHASQIKDVRSQDMLATESQTTFPLDWSADTTQKDIITFKGYEPGYKKSEVSGLPRLYYDHSKPFSKKVSFYDHFKASRMATAPRAYVIPCTWKNVIARLSQNGVSMEQLKHDSIISVTAYHIDNYETSSRPYEKHYLHKNVQVTAMHQAIHFQKGDYIIRLNQPAKRYLVETLEPTAPDAFFAWGFFDGILQEKEYYSDYVFEDVAADLLKKDAGLRKMLEDKRAADTSFAHSASAQLDFVYRHSPYLEPPYLRYPVFRIE